MPKPSQGRTTRACRTCRNLKVRCLPSEQGDVCEKCIRSGAQCVFEDHKPRRKRETPDSRRRVAALESKLNDLVAQVSSLNNTTSHGDDSYDSQDRGVSQSGSSKHSRTATFQETPSDLGNIDQFPTPRSQGSGQFQCPMESSETSGTRDRALDQFYEAGATPNVLVSKGILSITDIENYIGHFREMNFFFPFVIVPHDETIQKMLEDRPFLIHAVVAVASSSETYLQKVLEKSFREVMFRSLVFENRKSIDLLQSILIYVGWGHFFHIPKRDQSYQLTQMAFGLCVDLGLNLTPAAALEKRLGLHLDHYQPQEDSDAGLYWSIEARRAFVGCYYVSTTSSWIWAKPNSIEYSDHIFQCAKSITDSPECSSDNLILPLIQIQSTGDEYHRILRVDRDEPHSQAVLDRIAVHARSFQMKVASLKSSLTLTVASSTAIELAIHLATVHAYEQDLLSPFTGMSRLKNIGNATGSMSSRIDVLVNCLAAAVDYLDIFLTIPTRSYRSLGTSQWSGLVYCTLVIYRLSIGAPRLSWDAQVARETVRLENYLATICERVQNETMARFRDIGNSRDRDFYSLMGLIWRNVKNTYDRLRHLPQEQSSEDKEAVHATSFPDEFELQDKLVPRTGPIFKQGKTRSNYQRICPALQFWTVPEHSSSSANTMAEDPFLGVSGFDGDDGFWRQAFADMDKLGEQQSNGMDLEIESFEGLVFDRM